MHLSWLKEYNLLIFDEIDSTNAEALRLARSCLTGNFVIWAQSQTLGRGRRQRKWYSEFGNLYVSVLLNDNLVVSKHTELSFVTGVAVFDTITSLAKREKILLPMLLKWPNDILVDNKKVAGILLESTNIIKERYPLIIGVGINLQTSPLNIDQPTASLMECGIQRIDTGRVLNIFMNNFVKYFAMWQKRGFMPIRKHWLKRGTKVNTIITVDDGHSRISGAFQDIDFVGNIRVKLACGRICTLSIGEVYLENTVPNQT